MCVHCQPLACTVEANNPTATPHSCVSATARVLGLPMACDTHVGLERVKEMRILLDRASNRHPDRVQPVLEAVSAAHATRARRNGQAATSSPGAHVGRRLRRRLVAHGSICIDIVAALGTADIDGHVSCTAGAHACCWRKNSTHALLSYQRLLGGIPCSHGIRTCTCRPPGKPRRRLEAGRPTAARQGPLRRAPGACGVPSRRARPAIPGKARAR